jgi:hypothetical protein
MAKDNTKHLWLKEIAHAFGMTIKEFGEAIGYSRQSLYCASYGSCKLSQGHVQMAAYKLFSLSEKLMERDILIARELHEARVKLIDSFIQRVT